MPKETFVLIKEVLGKATGLQGPNLSLISYYALASHLLPGLGRFPPLVLYGPPGTGKSTIMEALTPLSRDPRRISCGGITPAALRDELAEAYDGVAFLEETDDARSGRAFEQLLIQRSCRQTSKLSLKVPKANKGGGIVFRQREVDIFGATVLHRRTPFRDPALTSRCLWVRTRRWSQSRGLERVPEDLAKGLRLPPNLDVDSVRVEGAESRTVDTWAPILAIANAVEDADFLAWAEEEIRGSSAGLRDGQSYEPQALLLRALLETCTKEGRDGEPVLPQVLQLPKLTHS